MAKKKEKRCCVSDANCLLCLRHKGTVPITKSKNTNHPMTVDERIESLLQDPQPNPEKSLIAAAIAEQEKAEREAKIGELKQQLEKVTNHTRDSVEELRKIRKKERKLTEYVKAAGKAEENFRVTGDLEAYNKAISEAVRDRFS